MESTQRGHKARYIALETGRSDKVQANAGMHSGGVSCHGPPGLSAFPNFLSRIQVYTSSTSVSR